MIATEGLKLLSKREKKVHSFVEKRKKPNDLDIVFPL
jgi:hypothetical protein